MARKDHGSPSRAKYISLPGVALVVLLQVLHCCRCCCGYVINHDNARHHKEHNADCPQKTFLQHDRQHLHVLCTEEGGRRVVHLSSQRIALCDDQLRSIQTAFQLCCSAPRQMAAGSAPTLAVFFFSFGKKKKNPYQAVK